MRTKNDKSIKPSEKDRRDMIQYTNLQLVSLDQPLFKDDYDATTKYSNQKFQNLTED